MMCGSARGDLAVAEEDPVADLGRGRAVVARPLLVVVLDHRPADRAQGVLPAHAVAVDEAHLQVGRHLEVLALVDVVAPVDVREDALARLGVGERHELLPDLVLERPVLLARRDDPLALAAPQVEVDLAEADRVGLRLRPVDALEELARGRRGPAASSPRSRP